MARVKNAKTKYEISKTTEPASFMRLAKFIVSVNDASEDELDESAYYDGDGTINSTVIGTKEAYDFEGSHDPEDAAQKYIAGLKHKEGDDRLVIFRVTNPDGSTETGKATVLNVVSRGGEASGYPVFSCTIQRTEKPTVAPSV